MSASVWEHRWLIALSVGLALLLGVFPLAGIGGWLRPEFVALVVIYWILVLPQGIGPFSVWVLGLVQDLVEGSVLGLHALALVVVSYVCFLSYQRLRSYALWQQSVWVFVLVGIHQLFDNWVHSLSGSSARSLMFLLPAFTSALCWPPLCLGLDRLRKVYRLL